MVSYASIPPPSAWIRDSSEMNNVDRTPSKKHSESRSPHPSRRSWRCRSPRTVHARPSGPALALRADRAILVTDPQAAGSDLIKTAVFWPRRSDARIPTSRSSASRAATRRRGALEGHRRPAPGPLRVADCAVTASERMVRVTRQTESGDEAIEVPLPALISVGEFDQRAPDIRRLGSLGSVQI